MTVILKDQIACIKREISMRQRVYPRWVEAGRMKQAKAEAEIRTMQAVLATLKSLEQKDRLL